MVQTYCGNSLNYSGLLAGTHVIGTNYECLRKGIGVGSHLPYDAQYAQPHAPIDQRRYYCGNNGLPAGYFAVGSPIKCLQIGIGVGKSQRAAMGPPAFMYFIRHVLPYMSFVLVMGVIMLVVYFTKPKFWVKKDNDNKDVIDWGKFVPYYVAMGLLVAIFIWFFWTRYVRRWI